MLYRKPLTPSTKHAGHCFLFFRFPLFFSFLFFFCSLPLRPASQVSAGSPWCNPSAVRRPTSSSPFAFFLVFSSGLVFSLCPRDSGPLGSATPWSVCLPSGLQFKVCSDVACVQPVPPPGLTIVCFVNWFIAQLDIDIMGIPAPKSFVPLDCTCI